MTDAASDSDPSPAGDDAGTDDSSSSGGSGIGSTLLELQTIDTDHDQLVNRRGRLPEIEHHRSAAEAVATWERTRAELRARLDELGGQVDGAERQAAELTTQTERLEAQLKTVIAPREAEALMHEIATLGERRDEVEFAEIEALEEQAEVDTRLSALLGDEEALRTAARAADDALDRASADIDAELADLARRRGEVVARLDAASLDRYERLRASSGVAAAKLVGHRCEGCHLDLSAAEVDSVRDEAAAAADGLAACPNCGRILIVD